ncbi:type II toxin-antitoxin system RelE/ParE family toxin [Scandinavium goeteborgense]|uniref:type II toxin-antitoxin system RelE/ParE family toxin n=1 Tax=Scandinavium goeteborgense TaxID=1851514 RepID=UPI0021669506|nr:type II toxin-antitoxin system RelE/ParE family toxin [Scandinavium goeteborgense]MCS2154172.1 type II toxin-antitoxin system RelE/ParE family toxin [Scandinavium goeteborgense]
MIMSFRHKGLRNLFFFDETAGVLPSHVKRLRNRLMVLDSATKASDLNLPGYRLHALTGDRQGVWSITVSGNWRLTFEFFNGDAHVLNYEDYH